MDCLIDALDQLLSQAQVLDIPTDSPESRRICRQVHCQQSLIMDSAVVSDDGFLVARDCRVLDARGLLAERWLVAKVRP